MLVNIKFVRGGKKKKFNGKSACEIPIMQIQQYHNMSAPLIFFLGVCPGVDDEFGGLLSSNLILLRNRLLDILLKQLFSCKEKSTVNAQ